MARLLVIYHYFYPDDVVSSLHFTQLAAGLADAGHEVDVLTSNRFCHRPAEALPPEGQIGSVRIFRVARRQVDRASFSARMFATAAFMLHLTAHMLRLQRRGAYDRIIIGTDPPLFFLPVALFRWMRMLPEVILWSFDLYPEAVAAAGKMSARTPVYRLLRAVARMAYRQIDHTVSIGPCMSSLIAGKRPLPEIAPWSFLETQTPAPFPMEHEGAFSRLKLLYAGNLGLAHSVAALEQLARVGAAVSLEIQISGRGQKFSQHNDQSLANKVTVLPFVTESELPARLSGADIHIVTLEPGWSGIVVPSKFFSALAFGRPVLFIGPATSSVAQWISKYGVGWIAGSDLEVTISEIVGVFSRPDQRAALQRRCLETYRQHFSRQAGLAAFRQLVSAGDKTG